MADTDDSASRRAVFVDQVVLGADPVTAAHLAGYAQPEARVPELLAQPVVRKALAARAAARLEGRCVPAALKVIERLLASDATPTAVAAKLALGVLDRAGIGAKTADPTNTRKDMENMSKEELEAILAQASTQGMIRDVTPGNALRNSEKPCLYQ